MKNDNSKRSKKQISLLQSWKKEKFYQNYFTFLVLQYNLIDYTKDKRMIFLYAVPTLGIENNYFYTRHPNNNDRWTIPMT